MASNCYYLVHIKDSFYTIITDAQIPVVSKTVVKDTLDLKKSVGIPIRLDDKIVYGVAVLMRPSYNQIMQEDFMKYVTNKQFAQTSEAMYFSKAELQEKQLCEMIIDQNEQFTRQGCSPDQYFNKRKFPFVEKEVLDHQYKTPRTQVIDKKQLSILYEKCNSVITACSQFSGYLAKLLTEGNGLNDNTSYRIFGKILLIDNKWPLDYELVKRLCASVKDFTTCFFCVCYLACKHSELRNCSITGNSKTSTPGDGGELKRMNSAKMYAIFDTAVHLFSMYNDHNSSIEVKRANELALRKMTQQHIREFFKYYRDHVSRHAKANELEKYPNFPIFYVVQSFQDVIQNPPYWMAVYLKDIPFSDLENDTSSQKSSSRNDTTSQLVKDHVTPRVSESGGDSSENELEDDMGQHATQFSKESKKMLRFADFFDESGDFLTL